MRASTGQLNHTILRTIGNTPIVQLRNVVPKNSADVLIKLEYFNPTGSYKDRMALAMIEEAGKYRVIDYKTGSVNKKFPNIESLFTRNDDKRNSEAFQTLLYCWLYDKSGKLALTPGLYDIKGMNEDNFTPEFKMGGTEFLDFSLVSEEFERHLEDLMN